MAFCQAKGWPWEYYQKCLEGASQADEGKDIVLGPGCEYLDEKSLVDQYGIGVYRLDARRIEAFETIDEFIRLYRKLTAEDE